MPKTALEELAEIKAAYEAQTTQIAALKAAASNSTGTVPADVQAAIDALDAEVNTPASTDSSAPADTTAGA